MTGKQAKERARRGRPYRPWPNAATAARAVKRELERFGEIPIRAQFDPAGWCLFCGEGGRCPGYHALAEIHPFRRRDNANAETRENNG